MPTSESPKMSAGRSGHNNFQGNQNRGAFQAGLPTQPRMAAVPLPFDPYAVTLLPLGPYDQHHTYGAQGYSVPYDMSGNYSAQAPYQYQDIYTSQPYNDPATMYPSQFPQVHQLFQEAANYGAMPAQQSSGFRGRTFSGSKRGGRGGGCDGRRGRNDYGAASPAESKDFPSGSSAVERDVKPHKSIQSSSSAGQSVENSEKNGQNGSVLSGSGPTGSGHPRDKMPQGVRANSAGRGARGNAAKSRRGFHSNGRGYDEYQYQQDDYEDARSRNAYKDSYNKPGKFRNRNDYSDQTWRDNGPDSRGRNVSSDQSGYGKRGQNDSLRRGKNFKDDRSRYEEKDAEEGRYWNRNHQDGPSSQKANPRKNFSKPQSDPLGDLSQDNQRERMIEMLRGNQYECMVCCDTVLNKHAIWTCDTCYHIFHIGCIKKWARTSLDPDTERWRCPSCQNAVRTVPSRCFCFCGKERDPESKRWDIPHGCGGPCGKERGKGCPHRCPILCHPGPCPPCSAMTESFCFCGKTSMKVRCGQGDMPSCDKECGSLRTCGRHICREICHPSPCASCSIMFSQECYGGHTKREVLCGSDEDKEQSFCCHQLCDKLLGCGQHRCQEECHAGECGPCPRLPEVADVCCCGKTKVSELDLPARQSCLEPLPVCGQVCHKQMSCGPPNQPHHCPKPCHEGPCGPCGDDKVTPVSCRCGSEVKEEACAEAVKLIEDPPRCKRRCNKKLNCRRHKCLEECCTLTDHVCDKVCGRKLNCNIHRCIEPCHNQPCKPCEETSFDEAACLCGKTVMLPPVYCGMTLPECPYPCTRSHACDHPVRHKCHTEDNCPPCVELIQRLCAGSHEERKNIPCYQKEVLCGKPCGKPLTCGNHACIRSCHSGPCEAEGFVCKQPCKEKRSLCPHPCSNPCHPHMPCPDNACTALVEVRCPCGRRVERVPCSAGSSSRTDNSELQRIVMQSLSMGASVDLTQINQARRNRTQELECDSECHILERNRRFAEALKINADASAKLSTPTYTPFLKDFIRTNPAQVMKIESELAELVKNVQEGRTSRSHTFKPMNRDSRRCVHELAEIYKCESQSFDDEPHRNVVVTAKRNTCCLPAITLTEMVDRPKAPPPVPHSRRLLASSAEPSSTSGWMQLSSANKSSASAAASSSSANTWDTKSSGSKMDEIDYFDYK